MLECLQCGAYSHKGLCFEKMKKIGNLEIYSLGSFPGKVQQSVSDFVYVG